MAKRVHIKSKRIYYKTTHPLYGSDNIFDSWMTLCELTMDLAEDEAKRRLNNLFVQTISDIADEMMDTAEEYEPQTDN
jgi:hypothetical protein